MEDNIVRIGSKMSKATRHEQTRKAIYYRRPVLFTDSQILIEYIPGMNMRFFKRFHQLFDQLRETLSEFSLTYQLQKQYEGVTLKKPTAELKITPEETLELTINKNIDTLQMVTQDQSRLAILKQARKEYLSLLFDGQPINIKFFSPLQASNNQYRMATITPAEWVSGTFEEFIKNTQFQISDDKAPAYTICHNNDIPTIESNTNTYSLKTKSAAIQVRSASPNSIELLHQQSIIRIPWT